MSPTAPTAHPSPELLARHASGWTPSAARLCVAVHLDGCRACQAQVRRQDESQAAFVDILPEAPMRADRLAALVAALEATPVEPPPAPRRIGDINLPLALSRVRVGSRRWAGPGFWVAALPEYRAEGWRAYLLRVPAARALPSHGHNGPELIAVLQGAFRDGRSYTAGDFVEFPPEHTHRLSVEGDAPCVCLIAHKGPLQLKGIARLIRDRLMV